MNLPNPVLEAINQLPLPHIEEEQLATLLEQQTRLLLGGDPEDPWPEA